MSRDVADVKANPHNKRKRDTPQSDLAVKKQRLLESRKQLPIWNRAEDIRALLRENDVLVLSGETGSGKSTQIPQFLLESSWCTGKIAVTQPRRVAAISLARRVAQEMGSPLGSSSPASKVGYSVRFDENTSPSTRIKFLTEGMLLKEILRDPLLGQYSCVIVDEVHERSVNVDLILGFVKGLIANPERKSQLKVVTMSATANVDTLAKFFSTGTHTPDESTEEPHEPRNGVGGDGTKGRRVSRTQDQDLHQPSTARDQPEESIQSQERQSVGLCHIEGRQYPVKTHYLDQPTQNVINTACNRIMHIHCAEPMPGDILVFLNGQENIRTIRKLVEDFSKELPTYIPKTLVLPLFAALPQNDQQRIFEKAPPNTRKIILSTNIAETSMTVPGVRFVVDTGYAKVKRFRPQTRLESLLNLPITRSSADQRAGRAGREAPGQCFRLFTERSYTELKKETKPEILHCDLASAILVLKARGVVDVRRFPWLTPPKHKALYSALETLLFLRTLDKRSRLNGLGQKIAQLPLTPALGRVVLEAAKPERDCLLEVIDIVACLSVENIFLDTEGEDAREKAQEARSQLFRRQSDHLTLLATVQAYASEQSDRRRWANDHFVSHRAMQNVMNVRKQLIAQCKQKLLSNPTVRFTMDEDTQDSVLKCFLYGYCPWNAAMLCSDKTYKTYLRNQTTGNYTTVAIHPSSVLFGKKVEAIMYNEYVYTNKAYARVVSAVRHDWVGECNDAPLFADGTNGPAEPMT